MKIWCVGIKSGDSWGGNFILSSKWRLQKLIVHASLLVRAATYLIPPSKCTNRHYDNRRVTLKLSFMSWKKSTYGLSKCSCRLPKSTCRFSKLVCVLLWYRHNWKTTLQLANISEKMPNLYLPEIRVLQLTLTKGRLEVGWSVNLFVLPWFFSRIYSYCRIDSFNTCCQYSQNARLQIPPIEIAKASWSVRTSLGKGVVGAFTVTKFT